MVVSLNNAILFAAYYAMNVTYATFLEDIYGFSTTEVGVAYLAPGQWAVPRIHFLLSLLFLPRPFNATNHLHTHTGLCLVAGSIISGRVSDFHRSRFMKNSPDQTPPHPEHRLHLQIPGILTSAAGVLMYGWFVHHRIHVASVIISTSLGRYHRFPPSSSFLFFSPFPFSTKLPT